MGSADCHVHWITLSLNCDKLIEHCIKVYACKAGEREVLILQN